MHLARQPKPPGAVPSCGRVRPHAIPTHRVCHSKPNAAFRAGPTRRLKWRATPASYVGRHAAAGDNSHGCSAAICTAEPGLPRLNGTCRPVKSSPTRMHVGGHFPSLHF